MVCGISIVDGGVHLPLQHQAAVGQGLMRQRHVLAGPMGRQLIVDTAGLDGAEPRQADGCLAGVGRAGQLRRFGHDDIEQGETGRVAQGGSLPP
ncbi:hypothetical protein AZA_86671 [Nitrospirillum viridazoti Y2]|nr:hypothetical protein AZA_86671 [Nitrospirillum amazonense Y2]